MTRRVPLQAARIRDEYAVRAAMKCRSYTGGMRRLVAVAVASITLAACGETGANRLSAGEVARVGALASELAADLGDSSPEAGVAIAAGRREAGQVFLNVRGGDDPEVIVVVLRGQFRPFKSPPPVEGEPAVEPDRFPVLIVFYDRATFEMRDLGERRQYPTQAQLSHFGEPVPLFQ